MSTQTQNPPDMKRVSRRRAKRAQKRQARGKKGDWLRRQLRGGA